MPGPETVHSPPPRAGLWVEFPLLFAIFLDLVGFGMAFPDIQLRAEKFAHEAGVARPGLIIGILLSSYFVVQIFASPHWGRLSDRVGRKPVIVVCTGLSALSMLAYAFASNVWGILGSRILAGLAAANVVVGQAYVADTTTEANRAARMGRVGAAITLGLIAGPALGGQLAAIGGNRLMGLAAAAASTVSFAWLILALPRARPTAERTPGKIPIFDLRLLRDLPVLRGLYILATISWFTLACLEGTFGRLIEAKLGYGQAEFGIVYSFESVIGALAGVLLGWLALRFRPYTLLRFGYILMAAGLLLTPFAGQIGYRIEFVAAIARPALIALFLVGALHAFGLGLANPTLNTLCSNATPKDRQGEMFGLLQAARSAGFVIGPVLGGLLFDLLPEAPYFIAGGVALVAAVLARGGPRVSKVSGEAG